MPNTNDHIKTLISQDKIEEALHRAGAMDGMMLLLQRELSQYQEFFLRGLVGLEQLSLRRSGVAYRLLCYLNIYNQTAHPPPANISDPDSSEVQPVQNLILPIEKTLIQKQLDMQKPVTVSAPKIMTFYFLERKERTITELLERMEQYRQEGHPNITRLLEALRESEYALRELFDVLNDSGFGSEMIAQTTRKGADLCMNLRREIRPAVLKKATVRSNLEDAEILLGRTLRQISEIKSSAERFSDS